MKNSSIGIFDSGLGGLTVAKCIMEELPNESIIYFGDTAHLPYGNKSKESIIKFSLSNVSFILKHDVKIIVVACNTSSAIALNALKKSIDLPIIGVIKPAVNKACEITRNKRIGVIGTIATIKSRVYSNAIKKKNKNIKVFEKETPLFVHLVEEGWIDHKITYEVAKEYLYPLKKEKIDTLILGCTHYPLLKKVIQKVVGEEVNLIDSAEEVANEIKKIIIKNNIMNNSNKPSFKFFVSDMPARFKELAQIFLNKKIDKVSLVNLE
jgi:glutamate racemase